MERVATEIPPATASPRRVRQGGFTLIEMLVAIGIILLLMTIGILGFRSIERSNSEKSTKSVLANAEALVKEMNAVGALAAIEAPASFTPAPVYTAGVALPNPGQVALGKPGRDAAILLNQKMARVLRSVPKNKVAMQNLPTAMLLPTQSSPAPYDPSIPVLADAWGNPLVYVPSAGLQGVTMAEAGPAGTGLTITSSGQATNVQNRGFWASAGPDGDFATGDDNIYSFQQ